MLELTALALLGGILRISPALAWIAVGDCLTQRSGRFNLGLEGIIPCGAVAALFTAELTGSAWAGVLGGATAGALLALLFALCCYLPRVNDLAVGIAFLVGGIALARFSGDRYVTVVAPALPSLDLALLFGFEGSRGSLELNVLLPLALLLALFLAWLMRHTRWGLMLTAAGGSKGHSALMAVGESAHMVRVVATTIGGMCAGVGGSVLVMFYPGGWSDHLADGIGISVLILVLLVRSRPIAAFVAALVYASIASASLALQISLGSGLHHVLNILPYLAILVALLVQKTSQRRHVMSEPVLRTIGLGKSYGGKKALHATDLVFNEARLSAVVGENGAAKSTLFNLIAGTIAPTTGSVVHRGQKLRAGSVRSASDAGIALLPQQGSLAADLTVLENFALALGNSGRIDWRRLRNDAKEALDRLSVTCALDERVRNLPQGVAKFVELARLVWSGKNILLLDEPTAVVGAERSAALFSTLKELTDNGMTILFSSHKVREVMQWADEICVLRQGKLVFSKPQDQLDEPSLLRSMFGERKESMVVQEILQRQENDKVVIELKSLVCKGLDSKPLDLAVNSGECVAVIGTPGNGQDQIMATISGLEKPVAGEIEICGKAMREGSMHDRGLRRLPGDATGQSGVVSMCVDENLILHDSLKDKYHWTRFNLLDWQTIGKKADTVIQTEKLAIPDGGFEFGWLSGGNQRKLLIARELDGRPEIFVAQNVEAGLDQVACSALADRLKKAKANGTGLLVFSEEVDFLNSVFDRIYQIKDGALTLIADCADSIQLQGND